MKADPFEPRFSLNGFEQMLVEIVGVDCTANLIGCFRYLLLVDRLHIILTKALIPDFGANQDR
jgi:hypothetical protein